MAECTGLTASWCPVHGDCTCPRRPDGEPLNVEDGGDYPRCPLHGYESTHAMPRVPGRRVRMQLSSGYMDVNVSEDASPETVAALRRIGEAAAKLMREAEGS